MALLVGWADKAQHPKSDILACWAYQPSLLHHNLCINIFELLNNAHSLHLRCFSGAFGRQQFINRILIFFNQASHLEKVTVILQ